MIVEIDRGTCVSCGLCRETFPNLSEQDPDDSFSRIVGTYRFEGNSAKGTPPESMKSCGREAADLCTVQIIRIEESQGIYTKSGNITSSHLQLCKAGRYGGIQTGRPGQT